MALDTVYNTTKNIAMALVIFHVTKNTAMALVTVFNRGACRQKTLKIAGGKPPENTEM